MRMRTDKAPPMSPAAMAKTRYIVPMSLWLVESSQRVKSRGRPCGPSTVVAAMVGTGALRFNGSNHLLAPRFHHKCQIVALVSNEQRSVDPGCAGHAVQLELDAAEKSVWRVEM